MVRYIGLLLCGCGCVLLVGRFIGRFIVVSGVVIMKMISSISMMLMNGVMLIVWVFFSVFLLWWVVCRVMWVVLVCCYGDVVVVEVV